MAVKFIHVVCKTCGAEVDKIEYDVGRVSKAVTDTAEALKISVEEAIALVKERNPGAEKSGEENSRTLASDIVAAPTESHVCPNGHTDGFEVTDDNPTAREGVALVKGT